MILSFGIWRYVNCLFGMYELHFWALQNFKQLGQSKLGQFLTCDATQVLPSYLPWMHRSKEFLDRKAHNLSQSHLFEPSLLDSSFGFQIQGFVSRNSSDIWMTGIYDGSEGFVVVHKQSSIMSFKKLDQEQIELLSNLCVSECLSWGHDSTFETLSSYIKRNLGIYNLFESLEV